jgi:hypothetical protein
LDFLKAIDSAETDAFRVLVVQDFEGVAVEDGDDEAGEICRKSGTGEKEGKECCHDNKHRSSC